MSARRDRITDEAASWLVRVQSTRFSKVDREEFASWLAGSAEHVLEYLSLAAISQDIREAPQEMDVNTLLALDRDAVDEHNVVAMFASGPATGKEGALRSKRSSRPLLWSAAASVLMAAGVVAWWWLFASGPVLYATGTGEQMSLPLEDGSVVVLNAQSSIEVSYTGLERTVRLLSGEVLFNAEEDPDRPFVVLTDRALIRAVGTSFNVRHRGGDTTVTVVEGLVDIRRLDSSQSSSAPPSRTLQQAQRSGEDAMPAENPLELLRAVRVSAGMQAHVHGETSEIAVASTKIENAMSWRDRRLVFEDRALSGVVAEFNLYSGVRLVFDDARLGSISISGSFDADDPESFALFLAEAGLAVADPRPDGVIALDMPR